MGEDNCPWLQPVIKAFGIEYLVDIEQREFRQFDDPANVINMYTEKGRQILKECLGREWYCFGLGKMGQNSDGGKCGRCGNRALAET